MFALESPGIAMLPDNVASSCGAHFVIKFRVAARLWCCVSCHFEILLRISPNSSLVCSNRTLYNLSLPLVKAVGEEQMHDLKGQ